MMELSDAYSSVVWVVNQRFPRAPHTANIYTAQSQYIAVISVPQAAKLNTHKTVMSNN